MSQLKSLKKKKIDCKEQVDFLQTQMIELHKKIVELKTELETLRNEQYWKERTIPVDPYNFHNVPPYTISSDSTITIVPGQLVYSSGTVASKEF